MFCDVSVDDHAAHVCMFVLLFVFRISVNHNGV